MDIVTLFSPVESIVRTLIIGVCVCVFVYCDVAVNLYKSVFYSNRTLFLDDVLTLFRDLLTDCVIKCNGFYRLLSE